MLESPLEQPPMESSIDRIYNATEEGLTPSSSEIQTPPPLKIYDSGFDEAPKKKFQLGKGHKIFLGVIIALIIIIAPIALAAVYTLGVITQMQLQANDIQNTGNDTYAHFKSQDLPGTEKGIQEKFC